MLISAMTTAVETTAALRAVRLVRTFGDGAHRRTALDNVDVELEPGKLALLMGPSGSGKSTLLAILSGLLPPDSGEVRQRKADGGRDIWALSQRERERWRLANVGFVFQGYNLFPALTAVQQLEIVLKWGMDLGGREANRRAVEMLERLGLGTQLHKKPSQLSGGEKQRVAIGRAMVKGSRFLFADEPTSALDWDNGRQVVELLRAAAHERGASIFLVSHDHRLLPFVDIAYHLEDGKLSDLSIAAEPEPEPASAAGAS